MRCLCGMPKRGLRQMCWGRVAVLLCIFAMPSNAAARPPLIELHSGEDLYRQIGRAEAERNGIPFELVDAIMAVESSYDWKARGRAGEVGLMQLLPATAAFMGFKGSLASLADPEINILYGARYLGVAWRLAGGDLCKTVMKYRAGHGETRFSARSKTYCQRVRTHLAQAEVKLKAAKSKPTLIAAAGVATNGAGQKPTLDPSVRRASREVTTMEVGKVLSRAVSSSNVAALDVAAKAEVTEPAQGRGLPEPSPEVEAMAVSKSPKRAVPGSNVAAVGVAAKAGVPKQESSPEVEAMAVSKLPKRAVSRANVAALDVAVKAGVPEPAQGRGVPKSSSEVEAMAVSKSPKRAVPRSNVAAVGVAVKAGVPEPAQVFSPGGGDGGQQIPETRLVELKSCRRRHRGKGGSAQAGVFSGSGDDGGQQITEARRFEIKYCCCRRRGEGGRA